MFVGSIFVLAAALLPAPVVPIANPSAATSQPVVSSVSPGSGTIGTSVTITGSGFDYGCTGGQSGQVFFGRVPATDATVSDGAATAVAPPQGAGSVPVRVTDCLGDLSTPSSADTFVYPLPVVSSVSPGRGRSAPALRSQARVSITAAPAGSRARCSSAGYRQRTRPLATGPPLPSRRRKARGRCP